MQLIFTVNCLLNMFILHICAGLCEFIRFAVFSFTSVTSISIFGAGLGQNLLFPGGESLSIIPNRNL